MDWARVFAIAIESAVLIALLGSMLFGAWLTIFDIGLQPKYRPIMAVALLLAGCIGTIFIITHLTSFYP
jgi:hypothetical protein